MLRVNTPTAAITDHLAVKIHSELYFCIGMNLCFHLKPAKFSLQIILYRAVRTTMTATVVTLSM